VCEHLRLPNVAHVADVFADAAARRGEYADLAAPLDALPPADHDDLAVARASVSVAPL